MMRFSAGLGAAYFLTMLAAPVMGHAAAATPAACTPGQGQFAPAGAQPDDIDGIRPGMTQAAAKAIFTCGKDRYVVRTVLRGPPKSAVPHLVLTAENAANRYTIFLAGSPGDERVIRIEKQTLFRGADAPTRKQVLDQLSAKYGKFTPLPELFQTEINTAGMIAKGYGPTAVSQTGDAWPFLCHNAASGGAVSTRTIDCGVTIDYRIDHRRAPDAVVWRLTLVSMDVRAAGRQVVLAANAATPPTAIPASAAGVPASATPVQRVMTVRPVIAR